VLTARVSLDNKKVNKHLVCLADFSLTEINKCTSNSVSGSETYTLYLEHLGGFLPLLKGKKISKIRPEFVIYDPQSSGKKEA
jgi:hypothetical protein